MSDTTNFTKLSQEDLALYKITDDGVHATIEVIERNKGA